MAGTWQADGRTTRRRLAAILREVDGVATLCAPSVGLVRGVPAPGSLVGEGAVLGELEQLGVLFELVAPEGTSGVVDEQGGARVGERAVGHGDVLVRLRPLALDAHAAQAAATTGTRADASRLVFRSPLSGRFYARASPDKPAFVQVGDEIATGHTVALLEVMKTFNRLTYGGAGLPERARVRAVLVKDEDDVEAGAPILELEAT